LFAELLRVIPLVSILKTVSSSVAETVNSPDGSLTIPWQKLPSKRSPQILLPHHPSRSDVRPERFERRVRLVSAIARGRRWLDDVVSGRVTTVAELCAREKCSIRQVNMTISLAFLAPNLVKAAQGVACLAASVSSGSVTRRLNGVGSLKRSASIRNSGSAGSRRLTFDFDLACIPSLFVIRAVAWLATSSSELL
jgi:hypothetical protein